MSNYGDKFPHVLTRKQNKTVSLMYSLKSNNNQMNGQQKEVLVLQILLINTLWAEM